MATVAVEVCAGKPHSLVAKVQGQHGAKKDAPLALENHQKGPSVAVTAYDKWKHPLRSIIHAEREDALEVVEVLKHAGGGDPRRTGRKKSLESFRAVTVKANAATGATVFEGRALHLEEPKVPPPETRNPEPETRNRKPETRNPIPKPLNPAP